MRKIFVIIAGITLIVAACSRKMAPASAIKIEQAQPASPDSTAIATGKILYDSRCGTCHGLQKVENWSATEWKDIMRSMAPKAKLTDVEAQHVTSYVMANAKKPS